MVESTILTSYPALRSGVDTARMPSGAVASWLENAGKKKTTFFGFRNNRPPFLPALLIARDLSELQM
jgi:hypothetical protein